MAVNDVFRGQKYASEKGIFSDAQAIREAIENAWTMADVLHNLGLRDSSSRRAQLSAAIKRYGLPLPGKEAILTSTSVLSDREKVRLAVESSRSVVDALNALGLSTAGKNYERLRLACKAHGLTPPLRWGVHADQRHKEAEPRSRWSILDESPDFVSGVVKSSESWSEVRRALNWNRLDKRDRAVLTQFAKSQGISFPPPNARGRVGHRSEASRLARVPDQEITQLAERCSSTTAMLRELNVPESQRSNLNARLAELGITVTYRPRLREIDENELREVFQKDSGARQKRVRQLALRFNLVPYKCAECQTGPEWRGQPMTLILDHINGDPCDHRLLNLRFMCPNCESQSPTHGSKNRRLRK